MISPIHAVITTKEHNNPFVCHIQVQIQIDWVKYDIDKDIEQSESFLEEMNPHPYFLFSTLVDKTC
ncbi:MAG: hypothetical protein L0H53_16850 [Candidatus Nitrosocosmicus sp.]|nr:hypothetical protein [Candidatus Nitrosocosmicus sp.]MDN5866710.1 hypothetical protein [Candidatus Nitrosocosmicus sp.]